MIKSFVKKNVTLFLMFSTIIQCGKLKDIEEKDTIYPSLFGLVDFTSPYLDILDSVKEVIVPGIPFAYNASAIAFESGYLMVFRFDGLNTKGEFTHRVGIIRLDENFIASSTPIHLITNSIPDDENSEDPRIFLFKDEIYVHYNKADTTPGRKSFGKRILHIGKIKYNKGAEEEFELIDQKPLFYDVDSPVEKNWPPFEVKGELYFIYSFSPLLILKADVTTGICTAVKDDSKFSLKNNWPSELGVVRGSSPAIPYDSGFLGIFHSSQYLTFADGQQKRVYYFGAFTLDKNGIPNKISELPFYSKELYLNDNSRLIAFPQSIIDKGDKFYILGGKNDDSIFVATVSKDNLLNSLKSIAP